MLILSLRKRPCTAWAEVASRPGTLRGVRGRYSEVADPSEGVDKAVAGVVQGLIVKLELEHIIRPENGQELHRLLRDGGPEAVKERMIGLGMTLTCGTLGPWPESDTHPTTAEGDPAE